MPGRLPTIFAIVLLAASLPAGASAADGGWTPVVPELTGQIASTVFLTDVTATSPTDAWVLGTVWNESPPALISHWDGAMWRRVAAPAIPGFHYTLDALDAVSAHDVWAVGSGNAFPQNIMNKGTAVIAHYDGAAWSLVPAPLPPSLVSFRLTDVDMLSAGDGWAVGTRTGPLPLGLEGIQPLVMRWQHGQWVQVDLPHIAGGYAMLEGVHVRAGDDVWVVGRQGETALVMHFDGTQWRRISVPHGGAAGADNILLAVTSVAAKEVWAVGTACVWVADPGDILCQPLALHLTEGMWRVVPAVGEGGTHLVDVVARSANDVWLVGYDAPPAGQHTMHVEHWDGTQLATVPTSPPSPAGHFTVQSGLASALNAAIVMPGVAELWAVGWLGNQAQVFRHR